MFKLNKWFNCEKHAHPQPTEINLTSRRFQAVQWLQSAVGELRIPSQPSEKEFVTCLRNGMILCNAINKIHPGPDAKVVENYSNLQSFNREYQLPQTWFPEVSVFRTVEANLVQLL
ncbi:hypothetical protein YC2023_029957 [Brassica napus]